MKPPKFRKSKKANKFSENFKESSGDGKSKAHVIGAALSKMAIGGGGKFK